MNKDQHKKWKRVWDLELKLKTLRRDDPKYQSVKAELRTARMMARTADPGWII